jgi:hypothetical protein
VSGHELDCLHCSIMRQAKLYVEAGHTHECVAGHVLTVLADLITLSCPSDHQVDAISDDVRNTLVQGIRDRMFFIKPTEGHA